VRFVALALVAAVIAGCGGDDKSTPTTPKPVTKTKKPAAKPKGVMLIFSGGAWLASPKSELEQTQHYRERYSRLGWLAVDVGYRPGGEQSYSDVAHAYEKARLAHPGLPICAVGESAGGQLALVLAIARPLDCVEAVDAPVDLTHGLPPQLARVAKGVFGKRLAKWSPALHAGAIKGKVLLVHAEDDKIVPVAQARQMKAALPRADLIVLRSGDLPFVHGTKIDRDQYTEYLKRERALLASVD
jgi:acetyl esterase/lipase